MDLPQIILASSSPFRKQLLEKLDLPFTTAKPDVDESPLENEPAEALVKRLAEQKAAVIAEQNPNTIVIGSDQVALVVEPDTDQQTILGKPGNFDNAHKQLSFLSGKKVTFLTGLSVQCLATKQSYSLVEPFEVGFRQLNTAEITAYLNKEQPFNCAGSFKSEGLGITLFRYLKGDDPNSLIGLPLIQLTQLLKEFGCDPLLYSA